MVLPRAELKPIRQCHRGHPHWGQDFRLDDLPVTAKYENTVFS